MSGNAPPGFVSAELIREKLGISVPTFWRRLDERRFIVYADPTDRRNKLLREEDAQILLTPQPAKRRGKELMA
jgi:hypothetical protein